MSPRESGQVFLGKRALSDVLEQPISLVFAQSDVAQRPLERVDIGPHHLAAFFPLFFLFIPIPPSESVPAILCARTDPTLPRNRFRTPIPRCHQPRFSL